MSLRGLGKILALLLGILAAPLVIHAQGARNVPKIGYLVLSPLADPPSAERRAFLEALRDLGYVVGQNLFIEYRAAAWNRELLPDLAAELVALKVDVIVAVPGTTDAAREATTTIPIVVPAANDPVESGLVASLARPGGEYNRHRGVDARVNREAAPAAQGSVSQSLPRRGALEPGL